MPWTRGSHSSSKDSSYLEEERCLALITLCEAVAKIVWKKACGEIRAGKVHRRKVALDLFTFWEPLGPSESSLLSPFGYDMLAVPLCLFITQKSYTPEKTYRCHLASGATWELPAREMDGPQGLFPQRTVALVVVTSSPAWAQWIFLLLFIDGTQCITYAEERSERSKERSWWLTRTLCLGKNTLSLWIYWRDWRLHPVKSPKV